ncbi:MAG: hypothetical protein K2R98_05790 [Gemmataceae bacterium]|nr:hypothetical protein [Gemmataceae bacterium]
MIRVVIVLCACFWASVIATLAAGSSMSSSPLSPANLQDAVVFGGVCGCIGTVPVAAVTACVGRSSLVAVIGIGSLAVATLSGLAYFVLAAACVSC